MLTRDRPGASAREPVDLEDLPGLAGRLERHSTATGRAIGRARRRQPPPDTGGGNATKHPTATASRRAPRSPTATPTARPTEPCAWVRPLRGIVAGTTGAERKCRPSTWSALPRSPRGSVGHFTGPLGQLRGRRHGGDDPVLTQADDGAAAGAARPDANHRTTRTCPRRPTANANNADVPVQGLRLVVRVDFRNVNGGDDSGIIDEYTHRLATVVIDADGAAALSTPHAGAMGEALEDRFASDLQVRDALKTDDSARPGRDRRRRLHRPRPARACSQALDCRSTSSSGCPGGAATGIGGYTFGDFGHVAGVPEVTPTARSGRRRCEIWARR